MTEGYWMDMPNGQWLHKCSHTKFEVTLGPLRKTCPFGECTATIPTGLEKKKDDPIPNSSWGLKNTPEDQSLDSFK